ncbi:VP1 [Potamochoerus porcus polyomavirus 1]|uniref:Capsid protein VP1 n=1 Tax=Potamochoerus porcus polyomavirus 1 TaxID=2170410 RepID=A0A2S1CJI6_9POLY|nr:VP1 [Potamochoerus porcus polyomavirus 1]AWD33730.1 VP1 [Potamochoerus porcus polyomavirus 1]
MSPPKRGQKPRPDPVPKLLIKGGIEVLGLRTGPDSTTTIELFLNPRMGQSPQSDYYGFSDNQRGATSRENEELINEELPRYSLGVVQLPMLNENLTDGVIMMWEAVSCKTEVVGINTLTTCHGFKKRFNPDPGHGAAMPIEGVNYHFFAVGGEPLELQFICEDYKAPYHAEAVKIPPKEKITNKAQVLDPTLKGILDKDGWYPVECWCPDPSKNENTRYFGTYTGGIQTPPVLQFTNSVTTILLDENGVGPLCKGDKLYVSAADICGFLTQPNDMQQFRGLPRYMSVTLRKRLVKNPYPISSLLNTIFNQSLPLMDGQKMEEQVEEVRVYQGVEELPGDPDMVRFINRFGQEESRIPHN